jgi:FlaG/FlaF family flagellin (archaellin)
MVAVSIALAVILAGAIASFIQTAAGDLAGRLESISQQEATQ